MESTSPIRRIRARSLVGWPILAGALLLGAAQMGARAFPHPAWTPAAMALAYVAWAWWIARTCRRHGIGARRLGLRPPRVPDAWRYLGLAVPLLLLSVGLLFVQVALLSWLAPGLLRGLAGEPTDPSSLLAGALGLLTTVVLAPIVEEVTFRGALLASWSRRFGQPRAIVATAALFAIFHPGDLIGSLVFGIVLAVVRLRAGTLWIPIICHALYNAAATLMRLGASPDPSAITSAELRQALWIGVACIAASAPVLVLFLRGYTVRGVWERVARR